MSETPVLMALHSSTEHFGVAVQDPESVADIQRVAVFNDGRGLSNTLITRVNTILPCERWSALKGLAVATGPGGFTGTRLSVVMARTLAEQLNCPLLGVSSFALMAARLHHRLPADQQGQRFWIARQLSRRGLVAGFYAFDEDDVEEIEAPHLVIEGRRISPVVQAAEDVAADVFRLLELLRQSQTRGQILTWSSVLPIYPFSPVGTS
ncbi:tRNA (adenosine(37)-N6)-threonylcarbamoyltransferase complex dimerization subunit type 1 TsaB [Synechococcus sp. M16CYN]|uniref:tRNA (adenosine(37)-N6)-threonylcarbamoyltransferase complex dimerization subunit type 1 TsaB n=1 Tax=Synechococcus sp. M16CYN TaxID=3103139 RepID=UPI003253C894